ncbi:hypothetical protein ACFL1D_00675 [Candidatus Omnitrophota bacterium]
MAKGYRFLIVFLATAAIFSTAKYIQLAWEKRQLLSNVEQIWNKISFLEQERDGLNQELKEKGLLEVYLATAEDQVTQINSKLIEAKNTIIELQLGMAELKGEKEKISQEAAMLRSEKAWLERRFHSVRELKKAIKEIKREMHFVKSDVRSRIESLATLGGNRGYLVKDGKSTYKKKVNIRVLPVTQE